MSRISLRSRDSRQRPDSAISTISYDDDIHYADGDDMMPDDQQKSWFSKFGNGLRSIWATKSMNAGKPAEGDVVVKTALRELVVYIIFLVILCIITFGMASPTLYWYTKILYELFQGDFEGIGSKDATWNYIDKSLIGNLYWETEFDNPAGRRVHDPTFIYHETKLLGLPRMRQLRVQNTTCESYDVFKLTKRCYLDFAEKVEAKEPFGLVNKPCFQWHTEKELKGASHGGRLNTYPGSGYYCDLGKNTTRSLEITSELRQNMWLDRATRALFIDFTLYNGNINLFCVVRLLVEYPSTGGAVPSWNFKTVKLLRYVTAMDYFVLACECIFLLFIVYYSIEEGIEISQHKLTYFKSFWNILDVTVLLLSYLCAACSIYRTIAVNNKLDILLANLDTYADFEQVAFWEMQFSNALAVDVFLAWIKLFKYVSFNKSLTTFSSTMSAAGKDLLGFAVMFCTIFFAFATVGYVVFGPQLKDFSTLLNALFTLFRIILGDFDFHALEQADRILGPLYFLLYIFFVFFVLLNMFLAIIGDTYSEVQERIAEEGNEFEVGDYFKKGMDKLVDRLHLKKDKLMDIQEALRNSDKDNDKKVDFSEWRNELKARGYAEVEIEATFARFDKDGDRVLDEDEIKAMHEELERERNAVDVDIEHANNGIDSDDEGRDECNIECELDENVCKGEFDALVSRVETMESSIGSIVCKIDTVLVRLESMEREKNKRKDSLRRLLATIKNSNNSVEELGRLLRNEMHQWLETDSRRSSAIGSSTRPSSTKSIERV